MVKTLTNQLARGSDLLSEKFTAADVWWGTAPNWTTKFKLVPELPVIVQYIERVNARPAAVRAQAKNAAILAA